ncbi:MAG TPA: hypothetical protein VMA36_17330 [Candidatus Limnocylindria bacterium]|nr:hypothetical protein [Candidatus Limnocylindria bacterium]
MPTENAPVRASSPVVVVVQRTAPSQPISSSRKSTCVGYRKIVTNGAGMTFFVCS